MHYLNEPIDLSEEFPFFFILDKQLSFLDFGNGYEDYLKLEKEKSSSDFFNLPWKDSKSLDEIDDINFASRVTFTDKNSITYKGKFKKTERL